ncbi:MAG: hypothetical protein R2704_00110 [Microthrixaceae bacterium]
MAIAGVGALMAMVTVAGGLFLLLSNRTEELRMRDYAEKMCDEVMTPLNDKFNDVTDSKEWEDRVVDRDVSNEREAEELIGVYRELADIGRESLDRLESFNGSHRVRGSDGEEVFEELEKYIEDGRDDLDSLMEDLDQLDPADEDRVLDDIDELGSDSTSLDANEGEPIADLQSELYEADEDCSLS